ncbi:MAG: DUF2953 domain-containing protein [Candidatus Acetothermia bacterium]
MEADWSENRLRASLSYMGFSWTIWRTGGKKEEKVEEESPAGKIEEGGQGSGGRGEWLGLVREVLPAARKFLANLVRFARISRLSLDGSYGFEDPCNTGVLYGYIEGFKGYLLSTFPVAKINVRPDFEEQKMNLVGRSRLEIRLASAIYVTIITGWYLPKRKIWRLIKQS